MAEEMCRRVASLDRVRFCNSGTEATLHAVRLAREFSGRPKIAKFEGGTTATTTASRSASPLPWRRPGPPMPRRRCPGPGAWPPTPPTRW